MKDTRDFLSWQQLAKKEFDSPLFLINPYVPSGGIVFLWGDTGVGKSPIGWEMARCIGTGASFFGLPTVVGKSLYIELDTPERLVAERLQKLSTWVPPEKGGVDFLFLPPLSVPVLSPKDLNLLHRAAERDYDFVVINTLRKCHSMNDKEPQTPKVVYEFFQRTFPAAALLFVHHAKKSQLNQASGSYEAGLSKESFSGAKNWINDAQVGINLRKFRNARAGTNLHLTHENTQISAEYKPLPLKLAGDGSNLTCPMADQIIHVRTLLTSLPDSSGNALDEYIAGHLGIGMTKARELRVAAGEPVWLPRKDMDEDSEDED